MHCDGGGLYLQVSIGAALIRRLSWIYRYTLAGQTHDMGLGSIADVSLVEARETARGYRKLAKQGIDPINHRDRSAPKISRRTSRPCRSIRLKPSICGNIDRRGNPPCMRITG
jgi:hypothetical protein